MSAPKLEYLTKCRVPGCGKEFVSDPFDLPVIGQPEARIVQFVTKLMEHAQKKHPEQMHQISGAIQQYMGFMVCSMFELEDPQLMQMQEAIRHALRLQSRKLIITDAEIADRVARLELDPEEEEGVGILLRDMRDLLSESGRYAPKLESKPLVTV